MEERASLGYDLNPDWRLQPRTGKETHCLLLTALSFILGLRRKRFDSPPPSLLLLLSLKQEETWLMSYTLELLLPGTCLTVIPGTCPGVHYEAQWLISLHLWLWSENSLSGQRIRKQKEKSSQKEVVAGTPSAPYHERSHLSQSKKPLFSPSQGPSLKNLPSHPSQKPDSHHGPLPGFYWLQGGNLIPTGQSFRFPANMDLVCRDSKSSQNVWIGRQVQSGPMGWLHSPMHWEKQKADLEEREWSICTQRSRNKKSRECGQSNWFITFQFQVPVPTEEA